MTDESVSRTGHFESLLEWLSTSNYRWAGLFIFNVWLVTMPTAVALRYSWRRGYASPPSREVYALVETLSNSLLLVALAILTLALAAPLYRLQRWKRHG